jgi:5-methylcytosine-specific restriction endonuclease McrA
VARSGFKSRVWKRNSLKECCYCREPLSLKDATVEHIIPKAYGGTDSAKNTALACQLCNTARGDLFDMAKVERNRARTARRKGIENLKPLDPHWRVVKMWQLFNEGNHA